MNKIYFSLFIFCFSILSSNANNVRVTNTQRIAADKTTISFNLSWEHSWYVLGLPANHDAVWIFIKYRQCGTSTDWNHGLLSTNMSDHTFDAGVTYAKAVSLNDRLGGVTLSTNNNTGVLIRRNTTGTGNIVNQLCTLKVTGGSGAVAFDVALDYDIRVFAIEMVQVPQGSFMIGDGLNSQGAHFALGTGAGACPDPSCPAGIITFENSGTQQVRYRPCVSSNGFGFNDCQDGTTYAPTLPANYPKGFNEFYCMKYEVSMGQYADFLNTLSGGSAFARYPGNNGTNRMSLYFNGTQYVSDRKDRAIAFMDWNDVCSYLDWAALRPMTELEYEKACKGTGGFEPGAYAWGMNGQKVEALNVSTPENGADTCTNLNANIHCWGFYNTVIAAITGGDAGQGPLGCGIFSRDGTTSRVYTGGTFGGIMEMSGNVREPVVSVEGTTYTGIWGDGLLNVSGVYNATNWPALACTNRSAIGARGGSWADWDMDCMIAGRRYMFYGTSGYQYCTRLSYDGCRGVR